MSRDLSFFPQGIFPREPLGRSAFILTALVLCLTLFQSSRSIAGELPRSNLLIFQLLARDLGKELSTEIRAADTATVALILRPQERAWILQGPIIDGLSNTGRKAVLRDGDVTAECTISSMSVRYEESRRASFMGERVVDRIVEVKGESLIADRRSGQVFHSGSFSKSLRDTIQVSAIPRLEDRTIPETRGALPEEGFFNWMAEPLIMIGAVAVSVYLLFHVRS
ncbi:MAG: hypothetical protein WB699_14290 [Bacteroidota bacterium]